jgi:hypothetical protein
MSSQDANQKKSYLGLMEARKNLLFAGDNVAAERLLDEARRMQEAGLVTAEESLAAAYL